MPAKGRRADRVSEDEVHRRWCALSFEQQLSLLRFDEPVLVDRIRSALQVLFERQDMMQNLCRELGYGGGSDAFESSSLLKDAFQFTWDIGRLASNPSVVVVDPTRSPIMIMKSEFLESNDFLEYMRGVLPDFISSKSPRSPLPRARWKELWATEPASMPALEERLAKLVEQALWAMAVDPEYAVPVIDEVEGDVQLEPWMAEYDDKVAKAREAAKAKKKRKQKPRIAPLAPMPENKIFREAKSTQESLVKASEAILLPKDKEEEEAEEEEEEEKDAAVGAAFSSDFAVHEPEHEVSIQEPEREASPAPREVDLPSQSVEEEHLLNEPAEDISHLPEVQARGNFFNLVVETSRSEPCGVAEDLLMPATPPCSPTGGYRTWKPPELVNYIWGQTAILQGRNKEDSCGVDPSTSLTSTCATSAMTRSTEAPASHSTSLSTSQCATPWPKGQWSLQQDSTPIGLSNTCRAVVRKTFIDIDFVDSECATPASKRSSRSHSPTGRDAVRNGKSANNDQWYWYWH